jgi:hypothetical protein
MNLSFTSHHSNKYIQNYSIKGNRPNCSIIGSKPDSLNSVRYDTNRHFRNKKREYLKGRINELPTQ